MTSNKNAESYSMESDGSEEATISSQSSRDNINYIPQYLSNWDYIKRILQLTTETVQKQKEIDKLRQRVEVCVSIAAEEAEKRRQMEQQLGERNRSGNVLDENYRMTFEKLITENMENLNLLDRFRAETTVKDAEIEQLKLQLREEQARSMALQQQIEREQTIATEVRMSILDRRNYSSETNAPSANTNTTSEQEELNDATSSENNDTFSLDPLESPESIEPLPFTRNQASRRENVRSSSFGSKFNKVRTSLLSRKGSIKNRKKHSNTWTSSAFEGENIKIYVGTSPSSKLHELRVRQHDSVASLKTLIQEKVGIGIQ